MSQSKKKDFHNRLIMTVLLGLVGFFAIAFLTVNVARDLRLLNSATSDNVQWTLSQAEVEFLEFEISLDAGLRDSDPDLVQMRRSFDIFYSRVQTLAQASIYAPVREVPAFSDNLTAIQTFLAQSVPTIDASDEVLAASLPVLSEAAREVRGNVRKLANSGLNFFATNSDARRERVFDTLFQLAAGVALLLLTLLVFSLYLGFLNRQNVRRRLKAIQTSKRLNVVTGTALDAVIVCDDDGLVLDFNAAAVQMFGYSAEDAIGSDLGALIVPDHHRAAHDAGMVRMRESGEKRVVGKGRIKLEAKRANGEIFPIEFAIQSAETEEGEIFISFLRDISHRIAAEENLVAARDRALAGEKAKTDFLATMSHEIRTPLNGLLGNLSLLRDTPLDAKQSQYIKNMDTSGRLLMSHISDVLDITKYDAGKLQLRPAVMNLSTLLQDIVDSQSGAAAANDTNLSWSWSGAPSDWILADKERIQHVLMNIIGNAIKFTRSGQITVTAQIIGDITSSPDVQLTIRDTGIGMNAALKSQIFDDFMTGDASYDRDVGGTGLGLGIALRFVKAMGGTIDVQSAEGEGSVFTVRFPVEPAVAPVSLDQTSHHPADLPSAHILLVEDNEINRMVASEMITAQGHTITEAHNGQIAVDLAAKQFFDLILMDISMPVMDGRTATRAIRASNGPCAKTPIVALTANAMAEEQQAFLEDGMNDIVTKPLSRAGLINVITQFTSRTSSTTKQPDVSATLVNPAHLTEMKEALGVVATQKLIARFVEEMDRALASLSTDLPLEETVGLAHKMSGSAATLGATELRNSLNKVENSAKVADTRAMDTAIQNLSGVWAETKSLLRLQ
ncbi:ATP-binding protein [uncultured Sulfitobacter sp.]|uniref:PAS domain-containing hybrid sensor histidine kinase/response regulator n=1 Tax=uncultured Sulfitobacter sp. TaxID=191468 RepID=UPI00261B5402|nr:ATP-binding protein [uncultured Sulfitobacter sp.]